MDTRIVELYGPEDLVRLKRKRLVATVLACVIGALALAVCLYFCFTATPKTANRLLVSTIIASTAGSWAVITIVHFLIDEYRYAEKHTEAILSGEREAVDGEFTLTKDRLLVKKGVAMLRVRVDGAPRVSSLQLFEKKKKRFEGVRTHRVYAVHGFVAAYEKEAADDEDS